MAFVEKAQASIQDLKNNFLQGEEYDTKTAGTRHVDPVTLVAEGVYSITRTEDTSTHLVYAVTIPAELGEVQQDLGLRSQGSFVINVKNPERPAVSLVPSFRPGLFVRPPVPVGHPPLGILFRQLGHKVYPLGHHAYSLFILPI